MSIHPTEVRALLQGHDFIGVRPAVIAGLGNDANAALVLTRIDFRTNQHSRDAHEDASGEWWWRASYDTIAAETGLTRDQVKRAVNVLTRGGFVMVSKFKLEGAYDQTVSYMLAPAPTDRADSPDRRAGMPDEDRADSPDVPSLQKVKNLSVMAPDGGKAKMTEADALVAFELWWKEYPRKVSKPQARKAYLIAIAKIFPDLLWQATRQFRLQVLGEQRDPRFIPHPATWLNNERWNDQDRVEGSGRDAIRSL